MNIQKIVKVTACDLIDCFLPQICLRVFVFEFFKCCTKGIFLLYIYIF